MSREDFAGRDVDGARRFRGQLEMLTGYGLTRLIFVLLHAQASLLLDFVGVALGRILTLITGQGRTGPDDAAIPVIPAGSGPGPIA